LSKILRKILRKNCLLLITFSHPIAHTLYIVGNLLLFINLKTVSKMILSTVSLKGGAGKTTIAVNLAVEYAHQGLKVALVDSDPNNKNTLRWSGYRSEDLPQVFTLSLSDDKALRNNIYIIDKQYDVVIIDGTPALADLTYTIMMVSDLVILPIQQSAWDIWAFNDQFLPKYKQLMHVKPDLDCRILRNATSRTIITREIQKLLESFNIPVLNTFIGRRVVYASCPAEGKGVTEGTDGNAKWEINKLFKEIHAIVTEKTEALCQ